MVLNNLGESEIEETDQPDNINLIGTNTDSDGTKPGDEDGCTNIIQAEVGMVLGEPLKEREQNMYYTKYTRVNQQEGQLESVF